MQILLSACLLLASCAWAQAESSGQSFAASLVQEDETRQALSRYLSSDQIQGLTPDERSELAKALQDPLWLERSSPYLRAIHGISPEQWRTLLSDRGRGRILLDWIRQRMDALQTYWLFLARRRPLTSEQRRHVQLLADAGLIRPEELERLRMLSRTRGDASWSAQETIPRGMPELEKEAAGRRFREGVGLEWTLPLYIPLAGIPEDRAAKERNPLFYYQRAMHMVLDPAGFGRSPPEAAYRPPADELRKRARLRQQIGHLFAAAERLRAERRLELRFFPESQMGGTMSVRLEAGPAGRASNWQVVMEIPDSFQACDPVLVAPVIVHKLQHAYDLSHRVRRHGLEAARLAGAFQEDEERAFLASGLVDEAYDSSFPRAVNRTGSGPAQALYASHQEILRALRLRDADPAAFRAALKELAAAELARQQAWRGSDAPWTLEARRQSLEQDLLELEAARRRADERPEAAPRREALEERIASLRQLLRLVAEEKKRALSLI